MRDFAGGAAHADEGRRLQLQPLGGDGHALGPLAPGASISVRFLLGVQQTGKFRFYLNIEALP